MDKNSYVTSSLESSGEIHLPSPKSFTTATLNVWNELPDRIKHDPTFTSFKLSYERHMEKMAAESARVSNAFLEEKGTSLMDPKSASPGTKLKCKFLPVEDSEDDGDDESIKKCSWARYIKTIGLATLWIMFTVILMMVHERLKVEHQISIPEGRTRSYWIPEPLHSPHVSVELQGALLPSYYANLSSASLMVWLELVEVNTRQFPNITAFSSADVIWTQNISDTWIIPLVSAEMIDFVPEMTTRNVFAVPDYNELMASNNVLRLRLMTNMNASFSVSLSYDLSPIKMEDGMIYAAIVLLSLYVLIVFEIVHRTLAAMLASTMSVAILAALNERPTMDELISWISIETLLLLFSMMILVAIFSETGIFDYLAVLAYKITSGKVWPLVNTLCFFTAFLSTFLDNVTTVLLMTPVTIRLCEVMELNPVPILMAMVMFSNIGGAMTPVGDPPNVIIASNPDIIEAGVNFSTFSLHMGVGIVLVGFVISMQLRFVFRNISDFRFTEPQDVQDLRHEIAIWQRAASSLSSYSKDEDLVRDTLHKKVRRLLSELKRKLVTGSVAIETYKATLEELQEKYPIRDKVLLVKSSVTLIFVISMFFLHSIPGLNLSLGWTALLGALLLLVLADNEDMEGVLARVEWSTLLFFASLFILMEALSRLGLIDWIGQQTEAIIMSVGEESRLTVAILLILWVSAAASSFVDNIPLTTMMVRIVTSLSKNRELNLPLQPLVWALALGACLGGNGTLIGASANLVCAGVAEQHGYRFTFMQYFRVGFPVMLVSMVIATIYLLIAHVAFSWH